MEDGEFCLPAACETSWTGGNVGFWIVNDTCEVKKRANLVRYCFFGYLFDK